MTIRKALGSIGSCCFFQSEGNTKGAVAQMRAGIERVTTAPGQAAARKADKMLANVTEAVTSGKWAARVGAVSLEEWKRKALEKGVGRVAAGVDAAKSDMAAFFSELFPFQESLQSRVQQMPDTTLEDSIQRSAEWIRGMAEFSRRRR